MKEENRINGRDMDDRLYKLLSFWRNHHFDCIHSFPPLIFILLVCLYLKCRHTKWIEWRHSNVKGSPIPHDQYLATSLASAERLKSLAPSWGFNWKEHGIWLWSKYCFPPISTTACHLSKESELFARSSVPSPSTDKNPSSVLPKWDRLGLFQMQNCSPS